MGGCSCGYGRVFCGLQQFSRSETGKGSGGGPGTGGFGGGADEPNLATVKVPYPRLDLLTEMFNPQRKVPADVQYLDVAGIAKGDGGISWTLGQRRGPSIS